MTVSGAAFEFGVGWDDEQSSFDVSLWFTRRNVDRTLYPMLTDSLFSLDEMRRLYTNVMAASAEVPVHFRLNVDGPGEYHSARWEMLRDHSAVLDERVTRCEWLGIGHGGIRDAPAARSWTSPTRMGRSRASRTARRAASTSTPR